MPRFIYTDEMVAYVTKQYQLVGIHDVTLRFNAKFGLNKTVKAMQSLLKNRNITTCRKQGDLNRGKTTLLNKEQIAYFKRVYVEHSAETALAMLNAEFGIDVRLKQIRSFCKNHGITSGRTGQFKKGHVPFHTGTKGLVKPNSGSFKKGQQPHNHQPVGAERINSEGYHYIKVAEPTVWRCKHHILWEQHNGIIPKNHIVRFIDGNRDNITIENLMLISQTMNSILNNYYRFMDFEPEALPTVILMARLQEKSNQLKRASDEK